ncbi:DDE-type integrase/transposase/recombinase [Gloeobacter morelensis MG652769]|uniref:DDE-type integrase/transposase/recombinase n=1 Tax=Gloeobacter morelensis MG652769 TaxID=2781736 RepID=A0ABY3PRH6_9CYAN|nr:DDE-type integrase/transposase/recombinase [Gloeobacter morelensis MG652769]
MLTARRDARAAKRFLRRVLKARHTSTPRVVNVDKNAAYPKAMEELQAEGVLSESCELRPVKYLNNLIEQDHRSIKRLTNAGLGFQRMRTAWRNAYDPQRSNPRYRERSN